MGEHTLEETISAVREYSMRHWKMGELHGVYHWDCVAENGRALYVPGVNLKVVLLFAYLHDAWRTNDDFDLKHGPNAAKGIVVLRDTLLANLNDEEFSLLQTACQKHTATTRTGNLTIDTCFDADRLDLWRVNNTPDPKRMATNKGKELAEAGYISPLRQQQMNQQEQNRPTWTSQKQLDQQ